MDEEDGMRHIARTSRAGLPYLDSWFVRTVCGLVVDARKRGATIATASADLCKRCETNQSRYDCEIPASAGWWDE